MASRRVNINNVEVERWEKSFRIVGDNVVHFCRGMDDVQTNNMIHIATLSYCHGVSVGVKRVQKKAAEVLGLSLPPG
jgi:hypothetical protein